MTSCSALGCTNRSDRVSKKIPGTSFHRFPSNEKRREEWIKAVRRKNWRPSKCSSLCSAHFTEEMIDRTSLVCVRLRENATPTIFKNIPKHSQSGKKLPLSATCGIKMKSSNVQNIKNAKGKADNSNSLMLLCEEACKEVEIKQEYDSGKDENLQSTIKVEPFQGIDEQENGNNKYILPLPIFKDGLCLTNVNTTTMPMIVHVGSGENRIIEPRNEMQVTNNSRSSTLLELSKNTLKTPYNKINSSSTLEKTLEDKNRHAANSNVILNKKNFNSDSETINVDNPIVLADGENNTSYTSACAKIQHNVSSVFIPSDKNTGNNLTMAQNVALSKFIYKLNFVNNVKVLCNTGIPRIEVQPKEKYEKVVQNSPLLDHSKGINNGANKKFVFPTEEELLKRKLDKANRTIANYKLKVKTLQQSNRRCKKRYANLASVAKKFKYVNAYGDKLMQTEGLEREFVERQIMKNWTTVPFSLEIRKFARMLYAYSPKAYKFVRSTFSSFIPHSRTVIKWNHAETENKVPNTVEENLASFDCISKNLIDSGICNSSDTDESCDNSLNADAENNVVSPNSSENIDETTNFICNEELNESVSVVHTL